MEQLLIQEQKKRHKYQWAIDVLRNEKQKQCIGVLCAKKGLDGKREVCAIGALLFAFGHEENGYYNAHAWETLGDYFYKKSGDALDLWTQIVYRNNGQEGHHQHSFSEIADWLESL